MTSFDADRPAGDPTTVCANCGGSGVDPEDFGQVPPTLGELRPCPDCDGRGEVY